MGITTTAAYLLVAIIIAPVLVRMRVPALAAHMFVFYYAVISTITPPVALAAAGIWALAWGACGYVFRELRIYERLALLACIPLTIPYSFLWNITGAGIIFLITAYLWLNKRGANRKGGAIA